MFFLKGLFRFEDFLGLERVVRGFRGLRALRDSGWSS